MDPRPRLSSLPLLKFILQSRWFEKCYKIDSAPFLAWSLGDRGRGLESCAALCWSECAVMARQVFTEWLGHAAASPHPRSRLKYFYHSENIFFPSGRGALSASQQPSLPRFRELFPSCIIFFISNIHRINEVLEYWTYFLWLCQHQQYASLIATVPSRLITVNGNMTIYDM